MTTAYHIDVHSNPPAVRENAGQELFMSGLFLILSLTVVLYICHEVLARGAQRAKDREREAILRRQRRRSGETGPFVHLRIDSRHHHYHRHLH